MFRVDIQCLSAPWENCTLDFDEAISRAFSLFDEYGGTVMLRYNETGKHYLTLE